MEDDEFRELQERSHQILALTQHPGWELLVDRATDGTWRKRELILSGNLTDHEQYKTTITWVTGAEFVLSIPSLIEQELGVEQERRHELELISEEEVAA